VEIVIKITDSEVKQALEEYGYEVTDQRVADVMESIASSRYVDTDEIVRTAVETLADEQDWLMAKM
jgi:Arc/MetJ-type ribon-helix-helix transcriptional regulator